MPQISQLALVAYSQFFWLLLVLALIYFGVGHFMVPKIQSTVEARDQRITGDLAAAQAARTAADETEAAYRARIDATWRDLGRYLEALPEVYDFGEVSRRTDEVIDSAWELTRLDVREQYPKILAAEQLAILPGWSNRLYQADRPLHVRLFVQ